MQSSVRGVVRLVVPVSLAAVFALGVLAVLACLFAARAAAQSPTPEVQRIEAVDGGYLMRAPFPGGAASEYLAAVFACGENGSLDVATFFGSFPADRRPVQLAVRTADGRVHRFGSVVSGGPESGFHSPLLENAEALRFAAAALTPGALVSNGFRSFWNRAPESDNAAALAYARACRPSPR